MRIRSIFVGMLIGTGIGLMTSIGIPYLFLWVLAIAFKRMAELQKNGERILATVTAIWPTMSGGLEFNSEPRPRLALSPVRQHGYLLIAQWQDPGTGKKYRYRTPIHNPDKDKFPVGSSVAFLINSNNPKRGFPVFLREQE